MGTWGQLLQELNRLRSDAQLNPPPEGSPSVWDILRRKYLRQLSSRTGRAVIVYASAFLEERQGLDAQALSIHLGDVQGFMEACSNIEERHAVQHTFIGTPTAKIIENHHGRAWVDAAHVVQLIPDGRPQPMQPAGPPTTQRPNRQQRRHPDR